MRHIESFQIDDEDTVNVLNLIMLWIRLTKQFPAVLNIFSNPYSVPVTGRALGPDMGVKPKALGIKLL